MASIKNMNQTIAKWLYGDGEITNEVNMLKEPYWILHVDGKEILPIQTSFDTNYNALMKAMEKAIGGGKEIPYQDCAKEMMWYAVYPDVEILNKREGIKNWSAKVSKFSCAFTSKNAMRVGHGEKFNHEFVKSSPILAMHYSLYRLIKNGLEY